MKYFPEKKSLFPLPIWNTSTVPRSHRFWGQNILLMSHQHTRERSIVAGDTIAATHSFYHLRTLQVGKLAKMQSWRNLGNGLRRETSRRQEKGWELGGCTRRHKWQSGAWGRKSLGEKRETFAVGRDGAEEGDSEGGFLQSLTLCYTSPTPLPWHTSDIILVTFSALEVWISF